MFERKLSSQDRMFINKQEARAKQFLALFKRTTDPRIKRRIGLSYLSAMRYIRYLKGEARDF